MNRNTMDRFATIPKEHMQRSKFDESCETITSWNLGEVIPLRVVEVLPGDTWTCKTSKVIRMPALLTPVMGNIICDIHAFFVPNRIIWTHFPEMMGENTSSPWYPSVQYTEPQVTSPSGGWSVGSLADYMGIPTGVGDLSVSDLKFRGYAKIIDEFFRDENLQQPVNIPVDDTTIAGSNGGNYITDLVKGGKPFIAAKTHDWATSMLPAPQKGPSVEIPVAVAADLPVMVGDRHDVNKTGNNINPVELYSYNSGDVFGYLKSANSGNVTVQSSSTPGSNTSAPSNLWAVQSGNAAAATINELRMAFQIQRLYERDARSGTRLIELIYSHFGTESGDARLQRPEYLGGNRFPLRIAQVLQQSETGSTPQGTPVGVSLTVDSHSDFTKSFTEHGHIFILCTMRIQHHVYQNGLHPMWSRTDRFSYYWPALAHIGELGVPNKCLYAQGSSVVNSDGDPVDDEIFGYQEPWWEYRTQPNIVTGELRSSYAQSLDVWHLADDYSSLPSLGSDWIKEDKSILDRVLTVTSSISNQFFGDFWFDLKATRVMPYYGVPGLIDHY